MLNYLNGTLGEEDRSIFEKEKAHDKELQERLELIEFTIRAVKMNGNKETIRRVQQEFIQEKLENKNFTGIATPGIEKKKMPVIFWLKIIAAVSITCLFLFTIYVLRNDGPSVYEARYISYEIAADWTLSTQENLLESLFIQGEFRQMFQAIAGRERERLSATELLLLGNAALELDSARASLAYLEQLGEIRDHTGSDDFHEELDFYLALTYLELENYHKALHLVEKIRKNETHRYSNNFSLLDQLSIKFRMLI
ncbi:hypothetical protein SAMN04488057_10848 [Cyclobacterium lianum]|uniref:Tetratricopeptide repeat-containing protein n=1 Tax=Cyclobacterium lianum TaxID=388280 RepID=A0A1M7PCZ7_9BACT|nr:hypothetical protein [Cyclobacterium lianum]SHN14747.1 hypothetical protein SAMN04488057_10848 [Cyclobacterium lianum]